MRFQLRCPQPSQTCTTVASVHAAYDDVLPSLLRPHHGSANVIQADPPLFQGTTHSGFTFFVTRTAGTLYAPAGRMVVCIVWSCLGSADGQPA
jgi:hypothetical protein